MTENSLANSTGEKLPLKKWRISLCLSVIVVIFGAGVAIRVMGSLPIPQPINVDGQGLIPVSYTHLTLPTNREV